MISEITPSQFQVPDNALWNIAGYVLTVLIAGFSGYRWGLKSQIAAKKLEVKIAALPLIEKFMNRAKSSDTGNWFALRQNSIGELLEPAIKLKSLLVGRKKRLMVIAWERFESITPHDFHVPQPDEEGEQTEKMRQFFVKRLTELRNAIENC